MPDTPIIAISLAPGLRTNGDVVSGILDLNLRLANEKEVEAVRISLRGEIHTHVTVQRTYSTGSTTQTSSQLIRERVRLFDQSMVVWTPGAQLPPGSSEVASFPFSFTLPAYELPPSFEGGNSNSGGSVKYYVHGVAERKSWYKRNIRVNQAFPFLPTDHTPAPYVILPNWPGELQFFKDSKKMRRGIVSHYGHVQAEFSMPSLPSIPLFRPIPVQLRIKCSSKPLSMSAENDLSKFEFPRNPDLIDCELVLRQSCRVRSQGHVRDCSNDLGLQGGFGKPDDKELRATWGRQVQTMISPPYWVVDEEEKHKGRWHEEVTFASTIIFRCPPPFNAQNIETADYLFLEIDFPGLGNKIKLNVGPLPLSSGIAPPHANQNPYNWGALPAEVTMPQAHHSPPGEMDLPPSYYDVVHFDEKEKE